RLLGDGAVADTTPPTATIASPVDGAQYTLGQVVNGSFTCADIGGSGLASCTGSLANGVALTTSTAGPVTFTVNAIDHAGNAWSATATYTVRAGDASGPVSGGTVVNT